MRALSRQMDPALASRPFDRGRDGFVGTGGGACLILEDLSVARERGATLHAEMLGWGQASDGFSTMAPHPEGEGLVRAMERALKQAGLTPADIGYINAHATSTPAGDLSEGRAIETLFSRHGHHPWVSSTKALTGHPLSMAGALEAGICVLSLREGIVPGAAHLRNPDPAFAPLRFPTQTLRQNPGIILSNSSGFGGSNVTLLFGPAPL
jgi:3-oxoacyl-[acyl-carrier-protein] synthase I